MKGNGTRTTLNDGHGLVAFGVNRSEVDKGLLVGWARPFLQFALHALEESKIHRPHGSHPYAAIFQIPAQSITQVQSQGLADGDSGRPSWGQWVMATTYSP